MRRVELLSCILKFLFCHCLVSTAFIPNFFSQNPIDKLPPDTADRGADIYNVVLNYCVDLICWDKDDELPDYLDVM